MVNELKRMPWEPPLEQMPGPQGQGGWPATVEQPSGWRPIESAPAEWKDGRELDGWDSREEVRSLIRWGKHNHVPLYGWIRQIELYGEEVDGFDPTHVRELPPPPEQEG